MLLILLFVLPFTLFGGMIAATILALVESRVAAILSRPFSQRLAYKEAQKDHTQLLKGY